MTWKHCFSFFGERIFIQILIITIIVCIECWVATHARGAEQLERRLKQSLMHRIYAIVSTSFALKIQLIDGFLLADWLSRPTVMAKDCATGLHTEPLRSLRVQSLYTEKHFGTQSSSDTVMKCPNRWQLWPSMARMTALCVQLFFRVNYAFDVKAK